MPWTRGQSYPVAGPGTNRHRGPRDIFCLVTPPASRQRLANAAIVLLALVASVTSLGNGFPLDDRVIVLENPAVHTLSGWWTLFGESYWPAARGGGLYRPVTMLGFAVQWVLGDGAPWIFHAVNIGLYACLALAVLRLARTAMPETAAIVAAALFAVHPVHVEAVANVVALSELLAALAMVLAVAIYIERRRAGPLRGRDVAVIAALYALACFSKEHGAMLPVLIAGAELVLLRDTGPLAVRWRASRTVALALIGVAAVYVAARYSALSGFKGEYPHVVWAVVPRSTRQLTMLGVSGQWMRLLFWPARLAADYTPPGVPLIDSWQWMLLPVAFGFYGLKGMVVVGWKRAPLVAFACAWVVVTLFPVSNTLVVAGLILAERTLLLPSVGVVLLAGAAASALLALQGPRAPQVRVAAAALCAALVVAGAAASAQRQLVWKDNETLFKQTVVDAPLSYRAHYNLGAWYFEHADPRAGERELQRAAALFPYDYEPMAYLANEYRKKDLCAPALPLYLKAIKLAPRANEVRIGLVGCLIAQADFDTARLTARRGMEFGGPATREYRRLIGVADSLQQLAVKP